MERIQMADGLDFSRIVYGMWRLADDQDTSPAHIQAKIEACLEQGITTMDQADIYGGYTAEALLGATLAAAPHLRDQLQIVTKCGIIAPTGKYADARVKHYDTSAAHIHASVDASLSSLNVEYIDMLLIHRPDPMMNHFETGEALDSIIASGKVRAVGVSNFRQWDWALLQSAMTTPLATNQIELSLLHNAPFTNGDLADLQQKGAPAMAWSPLAGGALLSTNNKALYDLMAELAADHDVTPSAIAIAWLLAHPAQILPIMGTNSIDRIQTLGQATSVEMDRQTWFALYEAARGQEVA